uniref:Sterol regulatory element-binding protein cleavage-activating protein n=1 Tax=Clastoptera arizonana TaxID=38151 RepID=A0A1B6CPD3_9HEMI
MANPRWAEASVPRGLPERVAQLYYTHGLFCATHPVTVIFLAFSLVLLCCYPLLSFPLPGNVPQYFSTLQIENSSKFLEKPRWLQSSSPACYVQQIVMKAAVSPWTDDLYLTDAIRAPLAEVFKLLEVIQNYQQPNSSVVLSDLCIHVETTNSKGGKEILPEYNCLLLSPANLWQQDEHRYNNDANLISTIYNYQSLQKGKISLAELLFGINLKDSGIKRYPVRKRQRIIQFAVTVVLEKIDKEYLEGLKDTLSRLYPLHQSEHNESNVTVHSENILHIYYPGEFDYKELVPLITAYLVFFIYIYFSVFKIEIVRSKFFIAVSAVVTVVASLSMSVGLCFFFGLELGGRGREIIPYLVVIVGLENILVLTKSVVYTPSHLDVKIRIAQGLSREGWSITKNLLTEVTILTAGLLTLVPAIQEFCIFAIVGLLSDFFLQMFFYTTVLGLDIKQMDHTENNQSVYYHRYSPVRNPVLPRSRSTPRLNYQTSQPKVPKRLRLVHFWARTRIVQRAFMLCMVIWIGGIIYSAGILEKIVPIDRVNLDKTMLSNEDFTTEAVTGRYKNPLAGEGGRRAAILEMEAKLLAAGEANKLRMNQSKDMDDLSRLKPGDYDPLHRISPHHWAAILSLYNTSFLPGSYITLLPAILLSSPVPPERAIALRNPFEKKMPQFQWNSLAAALDPLDLNDGEYSSISSSKSTVQSSDTPLVPTSPMELFLTAVLCAISVLVVAYMMVVLYRCICSRNYAEWRASWAGEKENKDTSTEVVLEAVPLVLRGHQQQVECLSTDGSSVVSSCLGGELRVWDVATGDPVATIDRKRFFALNRHNRTSLPAEGNKSQLESSLYTQISPNEEYTTKDDEDFYKELASTCSDSPKSPFLRSRTKMNPSTYNQPDFSSTICTAFTSQEFNPQHSPPNKNGFNYGSKINELYEEFNKSSQMQDNEMDGECCLCGEGAYCERRKRTSVSDEIRTSSGVVGENFLTDNVENWCVSQIWCLDCQDNLITVGCANGRLEIWEARSGKFKCLVGDSTNSNQGVTCVRLIGNYVLAARLNGSLDFYILDWSSRNSNFYRRTHMRTGSIGSSLEWTISDSSDDKLKSLWLSTARAHQQPITVLESEGGRVISGSQDHTLKVFSLIDQSTLYTLHGHCGPITTLFIDRVTPTMACSGSQDGMLCVWDLQTGACMYSIQAHDGYITSLTYSASYVISLGSDEKLCVWERFQGHLLNTIQVSQTYCSSMAMLTHNLLITSKQGSLVVWDVHLGEPVRIVKLGHSDNCVYVQHIVSLHDSVACDYGQQLRIVRFPLVQDKTD